MPKSEDYRRFVCVVVGENPQEVIAKYNATLEVPSYIKYKRKDAAKLQRDRILVLEALLNNPDLEPIEKATVEEEYDYIKGLSPWKYYEEELTEGMQYDDEGNALTTENPVGKYHYAKVGDLLSMPLILFDGSSTHQARKGDVDWTQVHLKGQDTYRVVWEMVIDGKKPEGATEEMLYQNMCSYHDYLMKYHNKKTYVAANTSFWGYAFCSQKTGWLELEDNMDQYEWVINFYYKFIEPLPDNALITIMECVR